MLSLDVTFDDNPAPGITDSLDHLNPSSPAKTHLGIQSCELVQRYLADFPNLKEVAILLKKFMALLELNCPYLGGLSSYSLVLLIIAYINYFDLRRVESTPARLLVGFLEFYGNVFSPDHTGISVINGG